MKQNALVLARDRQVRKANEMIQSSRFSLTTIQQKIILYLISKIQPYDEEFKEYEFDIIDFCKVCGIATDYKIGKYYIDLKAAIKELRDKSMWIDFGSGKSSLISWIEKARIDEGSGTIRIRLDNDLKPYLLQLKQNYTSYQLAYTLLFRSKYSFRLYEWACSVHYDELKPYTYVVSVEELKQRLEAETYKEYRDFKHRVLSTAIAEINKYSDKTIEYREIKQHRKVKHIELTIGTKTITDRLKVRDAIDEELGPDQYSLWDTTKGKDKPDSLYR